MQLMTPVFMLGCVALLNTSPQGIHKHLCINPAPTSSAPNLALAPVPTVEEWMSDVRGLASLCPGGDLAALERSFAGWRKDIEQRRMARIQPELDRVAALLASAGHDSGRASVEAAMGLTDLQRTSVQESLATASELNTLGYAAVEHWPEESPCRHFVLDHVRQRSRAALAACVSLLLPLPDDDLDRVLLANGVPFQASREELESYWHTREIRLPHAVKARHDITRVDQYSMECNAVAQGRSLATLPAADQETILAIDAKRRSARTKAARLMMDLWRSEWEWFQKAIAGLEPGRGEQALQTIGARFMPHVYPCPFLPTASTEESSAALAAIMQSYRVRIHTELDRMEVLAADYTEHALSRGWIDLSAPAERAYRDGLRQSGERMRVILAVCAQALEQADRAQFARLIPALAGHDAAASTVTVAPLSSNWPLMAVHSSVSWLVGGPEHDELQW